MPFRLKPSPKRKVTIESLHDPVRECYFERVTVEGDEVHGGVWSKDYYGDERLPFTEASNMAFTAAWADPGGVEDAG